MDKRMVKKVMNTYMYRLKKTELRRIIEDQKLDESIEAGLQDRSWIKGQKLDESIEAGLQDRSWIKGQKLDKRIETG